MRNTHDFNQIRTERERAGVTLEKLSAETGIPLSSLARYQDSEHVPMSAMAKIADVLDIPISALMEKREIPDGEKLTYDQLSLQLQSSQQRNIFEATRYEGLQRSYHWAIAIVVVLSLFLIYVIVDRFFFPNAGLFRAGVFHTTARGWGHIL